MLPGRSLRVLTCRVLRCRRLPFRVRFKRCRVLVLMLSMGWLMMLRWSLWSRVLFGLMRWIRMSFLDRVITMWILFGWLGFILSRLCILRINRALRWCRRLSLFGLLLRLRIRFGCRTLRSFMVIRRLLARILVSLVLLMRVRFRIKWEFFGMLRGIRLFIIRGIMRIGIRRWSLVSRF